ncbi:MAG: tRNA (N6-isopentenyl adenosine(37)-C2)-methylthiotransferase MiaB [Candidatus Omnitrophica bacterium]|nr:tRNA (N6-isopentenyl adenosine(37)-C2)-methylthiotransferase MiaB [Candidatus Omnitrophota bacterium]
MKKNIMQNIDESKKDKVFMPNSKRRENFSPKNSEISSSPEFGMATKRLYIKTFGCQMNDRDSEALSGLLLAKGYFLAEDIDCADIVLVNTCSVRDHAESRAISFLGTFRKLPQDKVKKVLGLIGCMAQNIGETLIKKMPHINLVCGPSNLDRIPEYIEQIIKNKTKIIDLEHRPRQEEFYKNFYRAESTSAQVVISVGCSNYCSYCVVPYVRGNLYVRNPEDIIEEVKMNMDLGIQKITLLGQNVNDYQFRPSTIDHRLSTVNFVDLLRRISDVEGVKEIDFMTSNPRNISKELFYLMAQRSNIKKHLHLPCQSGSDRILKMMNRGYSRQEYIDITESYKDIVAGTLSTDVIVGFPTETDEDFSATQEMLEEVEFKGAYIFKYSPRPGTAASKLEDDVTVEIKQQRHQLLLSFQKQISLRV